MNSIKIIFIISMFSMLHAENNSSLFDEYHTALCKVLVNTSNSIDDYFIEDKNSTLSSTTSAELSTSFAKETHLDFEKDVRFRLRLNLPKIQKNLRLLFEDENSDNLLYDGTNLNNQHLEDKQYYLRLEYFSFVKDTFNMKLGGGVRFRDGNIVPYLNINAEYEFYNQSKNHSKFFNRFRYYSDGEIENNFEFNSLLRFNESLYLTFNNDLYFSNEHKRERLSNDVTAIYLLNDKQQIRLGLGILSRVDDFEKLFVDYYYLHSSFRHIYYKDLLYYELSPSVLKREINGFDTSYRFLVNFGVYFKSD